MAHLHRSLPASYWWAPAAALSSYGLLHLGVPLEAQFSLWLLSALPISLLQRRRKHRDLRRGVLLACEFMVDPTLEELRQRAAELKLGCPTADDEFL